MSKLVLLYSLLSSVPASTVGQGVTASSRGELAAFDGLGVVDARPTRRALEGEFDRPRLSIGGRIASMVGNGELLWSKSRYGNAIYAWEGTGAAVQVDLGVRLSQAWTIFGGYEYGQMKADFVRGFDVKSHAFVGGFRATTNRYGTFGLIAEIGAGFRSTVWNTEGDVTFINGFEPLRAALGVSLITSPRLRMNAMFGISVGQFTTMDAGERACANADRTKCDQLTGGDRKWHAFRTISIGGTFDL